MGYLTKEECVKRRGVGASQCEKGRSGDAGAGCSVLRGAEKVSASGGAGGRRTGVGLRARVSCADGRGQGGVEGGRRGCWRGTLRE